MANRYGLNFICWSPITPRSSEYDVIWKQARCRCEWLRSAHAGFRCNRDSIWVFYYSQRDTRTQVQRTRPCEHEGRNECDDSIGNECHRWPANCQKPAESMGQSPSWPQKSQPWSLIFDFWPPELGEDTFLFLKSSSLWFLVTTAPVSSWTNTWKELYEKQLLF